MKGPGVVKSQLPYQRPLTKCCSLLQEFCTEGDHPELAPATIPIFSFDQKSSSAAIAVVWAFRSKLASQYLEVKSARVNHKRSVCVCTNQSDLFCSRKKILYLKHTQCTPFSLHTWTGCAATLSSWLSSLQPWWHFWDHVTPLRFFVSWREI